MKRTPLKPRTKPLKRGKPPKTRKPLSRSRLVRTVVKRIKSRGRSRFPKRREPLLVAWIRGHLCALAGRGFGRTTIPVSEYCGPRPDRQRTEPAHIKTQGSGGYDRDNVVPLCPKHHDEQEGHTKEFKAKYGVDLKDLAKSYTRQFDRQVELGWPGEPDAP